MRLYVGGAQGVGKTTVCRMLGQQAGVPVFHGSEVLRDAAGLAHVDAIRSLRAETLESIRQAMYERLCRQHDTMVLEGHFLLRPNDIEAFDVLVLLAASPERVMARRQSDTTRARSTDLEEIRRDIAQTAARAHALVRFDRQLEVIVNDGDISRAVNRLLDLMQSIGQGSAPGPA